MLSIDGEGVDLAAASDGLLLRREAERAGPRRGEECAPRVLSPGLALKQWRSDRKSWADPRSALEDLDSKR